MGKAMTYSDNQFRRQFLINLNQIQVTRFKVLMNKPSKEPTKNTVIIIPGARQQQPKQKQFQLKRHQPLPVGVGNGQGSVELAIGHYINQINSLQFQNNRLSMQLRKSLEEKKELADLIASFQEISKDDTDEKKKRVRRCANEIERKYVCTVTGCDKSYGTEASMAQHMRLKHPEVEYSYNINSSQQRNKRNYKQEEYQQGNIDS